jgi:hypothetical protein
MTIGKQLSDNNPSGTALGQSATDLIGFYGTTPVAQRTSAAQATVAVLTATTGSGVYGFTTSTLFSAFCAQVEEIRATLAATGLFKGS